MKCHETIFGYFLSNNLGPQLINGLKKFVSPQPNQTYETFDIKRVKNVLTSMKAFI